MPWMQRDGFLALPVAHMPDAAAFFLVSGMRWSLAHCITVNAKTCSRLVRLAKLATSPNSMLCISRKKKTLDQHFSRTEA
jgi:hypothetical protein